MSDERECENPAAFRYTWPGRDESAICAICALKMAQVINAMGLYVQMIPLSDGPLPDEWPNCKQRVKSDER